MSSNVIPLAPRPDERTVSSRVNAASRYSLESLPLLLDVPRAAKLLGISRSAAYRLANTDELPCRRLGGRIYVITVQLFKMVGAA